jgi:hypothetical protein
MCSMISPMVIALCVESSRQKPPHARAKANMQIFG